MSSHLDRVFWHIKKLKSSFSPLPLVDGSYEMFVNHQMWLNISTLASTVQMTLSRNLVVCSDAFLQTQLCCCVLFREKRICSGNPSKQVIHVQSFLYCHELQTVACWGLWSLWRRSWVFLQISLSIASLRWIYQNNLWSLPNMRSGVLQLHGLL